MFLSPQEAVYHLVRTAGHARYGWIRHGAAAIGLLEPYARRMIVHGGGRKMAEMMRRANTHTECPNWVSVLTSHRPGQRHYVMHTAWPRFIVSEREGVKWIDMQPVNSARWIWSAGQRFDLTRKGWCCLGDWAVHPRAVVAPGGQWVWFDAPDDTEELLRIVAEYNMTTPSTPSL